MRPRPCCLASPSRRSSCFSRAANRVEIPEFAPVAGPGLWRESATGHLFSGNSGSGGFKTLPARLSLARTPSPPDSKSGGRNLLGTVGVVGAWPQVCGAETMESALVQAYQNNPQLNAQRASARVTDEAVPQALSGYRPRASVTATLGEQYSDVTTRANSQGINTYARSHATTTPYSGTGTVSQTLFNGFQTANRTRVAESQVSAAREGLRIMEQTVLLAAATAYMDVLRDTANLEVQRTNVRVLEETLKQTRDRFN